MTTATPGQASWTARVLLLEGSPDDPDDYAEITSRWDRWLDDDQREAEEVGARAAIETAESHSAIYLNEISRLAAALRTIRDAHAPGEPGFDVARRTLDDAAWVIGTRSQLRPAPGPEACAQHDDAAERADVLRMRREMAREAGDDSPGADLDDDGYPDSEREADALAYQRNGDDERDDQ